MEKHRSRLKWASGTVLAQLQNERHCGSVLARKTWTPSYLDHKSKKNRQNEEALKNLVHSGQKKFVRYDEGKVLYSMGLHSFQEIAKEAGAVYHIKRMVLVNTEKIDKYLENFCDEPCE